MAYSAWPLEFLVATGIRPTVSYVSELAAQGRPSRWLFILCDAVSGALVMLGSTHRLISTPRSAPRQRILWAVLVAFGTATCLNSTLAPMACAPSLDPACERAGSGEAGASAQALFHLALSTMAELTLLVAMAVATGAARQGRGRGLLGVSAVGNIGLLLVDVLMSLSPGSWHGIPQRAHVVMASVWLVCLALADQSRVRTPAGVCTSGEAAQRDHECAGPIRCAQRGEIERKREIV
ncbi:DUF998 domain-containing protein [Streptomyces sp. NPDC059443]|uniref:DUF998 domain-containing protein n=1 Tax=unclassified Streptomyces TaxID=2593676 RepID=UPI003697D711